MAFDFPNAPTLGQIFQPAGGGTTWRWDGEKWAGGGTGGTALIDVSDTPPLNPADKMLWYESDSGGLYVRLNDTNTTQWVQVNTAPGPALLTAGRNRLNNGDFMINQRGVTSTAVAGAYICDRWMYMGINNGSAIWSEEHLLTRAGSRMVSLASGTAKPALAATDYVALAQTIEGTTIADLGWGYGHAQPVTLSFRASAIPNGTMSVSLRNGTSDRSYVATVDLTATHQNFKITFPGCTDGVWKFDNTGAVQVWFIHSCGTTFQTPTKDAWVSGNYIAHSSQTNYLNAVNQSIWIADVQLEPGLTATPFEKKSYGDNLRDCQRYFEQLVGGIYNAVTTDNYAREFWYFKVMKRAVPTIVLGAGSAADAALAALDSVYCYKANASVNVTGGTTASADI